MLEFFANLTKEIEFGMLVFKLLILLHYQQLVRCLILGSFLLLLLSSLSTLCTLFKCHTIVLILNNLV